MNVATGMAFMGLTFAAPAIALTMGSAQVTVSSFIPFAQMTNM